MIPRYVAARREAKERNSPETLDKWCTMVSNDLFAYVKALYLISDLWHIADLDEATLKNLLKEAVREGAFPVLEELNNPEDQ